jgi:hypothetical protein
MVTLNVKCIFFEPLSAGKRPFPLAYFAAVFPSVVRKNAYGSVIPSVIPSVILPWSFPLPHPFPRLWLCKCMFRTWKNSNFPLLKVSLTRSDSFHDSICEISHMNCGISSISSKGPQDAGTHHVSRHNVRVRLHVSNSAFETPSDSAHDLHIEGFDFQFSII